LLNARGYNPVPRDSDVANAGKTVPPEEADVFKFTFKQGKDDIDDAWVTIDGAQNLILYYDQDLADKASERTPGTQFDDSWYGLLNHLKKWSHSRQLSFKLEPKEKIDSDMAQRTYMKKKEQIAEGYYPMGKTASYSDAVPTVKIILQHSRQIQEGEQRYRNVSKIFLENAEGERFLSPTNKPGLAQVYARHLAEGGVPNDERWNHLKSLCEEYSQMAGFVRAVRNNQFNESAQRLVNEGLNHYQGLRESLSKLRGSRGYNTYFESWTPALMETEGDDQTNLNELFVQETLDPRIESVIPILNKLSKNLGEMKEVSELAEWADSLIESPGAETLAHNQATEKSRLDAFDLDENDGGQQALNPVGIPEEDELDEAMDPEKRARLDDLIDMYRDSTDPSDYYDRDYEDPEEVLNMIRSEFGEKIASDLASGADKMHYGRHDIVRGDPLDWKSIKGDNRVTKAGKLFKQDSDYMKNAMKSRYKLSGKSATEGVEEGLGDIAKKVGGALKTGAKAVGKAIVGKDDDELLKDLQKKAGVRGPNHGKPSMAYSDVEKVDEELDADQKRAGQWGPTGGPAKIGNLVGEGQEDLDALKRLLGK
jgi:phage terminase small subunit